jgi:hypothetical protein
MANTLSAQTIIARSAALAWDDMPGLCDEITWAEEGSKMNGVNLSDVSIDPANNTGPTVNLRRPSRVDASLATVGYDYTLPGVVSPEVGYQTQVDATVPLTVNIRAEVNVQLSIDELAMYLTKGQNRERHINPAIASLKAILNKAIVGAVAGQAGQSITMGTGESNYSQNWLKAATDAHNLMVERNATTYEDSKLTALIPGSVMSRFNANAGVVYNMTDSIRGAQADGNPIPRLGGFRIVRSPLTGVQSIPVAPAAVTTTGASGLTTYGNSWTVVLAGLTANAVYAKGTVVAFALASGVTVNWLNPLSKDDTGVQATFTLAAAATADGAGAATFTLVEGLTYTGSFRNVTISAALPNGSTMTFVNSGAAAQSERQQFLFTPKAIVGVSPEIVVPKGIHNVTQWRQNGISITIGSTTYPNTWQEVTKIVALAGVTTLLPEGVVRLLKAS